MRLKSGLFIGIFGLIVVLMGGWVFTLATALLTYLALLEFFRMAEFKGIRPATKTTLFSSFIIIVFTYLETLVCLKEKFQIQFCQSVQLGYALGYFCNQNLGQFQTLQHLFLDYSI